jgi:hypothetical protein
VHFLLARTAAKSLVGIVTQACIFAVFAAPPAISTPLPAAIIVKTEDMKTMLQDTLRRIENMFTGTIYQNAHGRAAAAHAPSQQYAALP